MLYLTKGSGNSFKPAMVIRHTGTKVNVKYFDVTVDKTCTADYSSINSRGVVPYLTLPDGTALAEPNGIAWYFAEGTKLLPQLAVGRAQTVCWMNFEKCQLDANLSALRKSKLTAPEPGTECTQMVQVWHEQGNAALEVLNKHLSGRSFITDYGYGVADIAVFGCTHLAEESGFTLSDYPAVCQWIERVGNETGYLLIDELLDGHDSYCVDSAA